MYPFPFDLKSLYGPVKDQVLSIRHSERATVTVLHADFESAAETEKTAKT